jgi:glucose uptake protein GlcU
MAMFNARNAICLSLLIAFIAGANWALGQLSKSMEFASFMIFGAVTVAIMVCLGFAWDWIERRRSRP